MLCNRLSSYKCFYPCPEYDWKCPTWSHPSAGTICISLRNFSTAPYRLKIRENTEDTWRLSARLRLRLKDSTVRRVAFQMEHRAPGNELLGLRGWTETDRAGRDLRLAWPPSVGSQPDSDSWLRSLVIRRCSMAAFLNRRGCTYFATN